MSAAASTPPRKTDLGQDELRRRTHKLSQRHRTVLLLVDGKRSRDQVINLAAQAGVAGSVYAELIELGMIEAPAALWVVTAADALSEPVAATLSEASPTPRLAVEVAEAAAAFTAELSAAPRPPSESARSTAATNPVPAPALAASALLLPRSAPASTAMPAPIGPAEPGSLRSARVKSSAPAYRRPVVTPKPLPPVLVSTVEDPGGEPRAPGVPARAVLSGADADDAALCAEVRGLLIGTLLLDGPVSSSMLALRIRRTVGRAELVPLVWQIERALVLARTPREAQWRLMKARDLLGLGNTVAVDDSAPGRFDNDDLSARP